MSTRVRPTDLLIAPPTMPDTRFRNSVLMVTHTNPQGSFALCVNRPLDQTLNDISDGIDLDVGGLPNLPLHWGGPMSPQSLWMLHSSDWVISGSVMITSAWAMTSNEAMFHHLADGDFPRHFRMIMGFASWAPGQLELEMNGQGPWSQKHSWLVAQNLGPEWLFDQSCEDLWGNVITLSSHQAVDSWL